LQAATIGIRKSGFRRSPAAEPLSCSGTGKRVRLKNRRRVKGSLSFTGVYYAHPVLLDSYRVVGATLFDASLLNS
ncbi:hypothetical protein, partial [Mesorhizobium sp.]|uniref:hypothetical protein n=1 Tax=Mesorhizobium sp. TaxID=1871066 RepID=UPI0025C61AF9